MKKFLGVLLLTLSLFAFVACDLFSDDSSAKAVNNHTDQIASVKGVFYGSLQEAIDAATTVDGDKVVLLCDVTGPGAKVNKNITIDFNGHTYTVKEGSVESASKAVATPIQTVGFRIPGNKKVTFLKAKLKAAADFTEALIESLGELTIKSSTIEPVPGHVVMSIRSGSVNLDADSSSKIKGAIGIGKDVTSVIFATTPSDVVFTGKVDGKVVYDKTTQTDLKPAVAMIGNKGFTSLTDAVTSAKNGETIIMLSDVELEKSCEVEHNITLDLCGCYIEPVSSWAEADGDSLFTVLRGGKFTVDDSSSKKNGKIDYSSNTNIYSAIKLTKKGEADTGKDAEFVLNNGTLIGCFYGITGNGSRHDTKITINGGTVKGNLAEDNLAVYHPQNGELIINGGTFEGYSSAIEMRAGKLTINGGSFKSTAKTYSCDPNGSGNTTVGAAIAIAQHSTKKDIEVTINGGEFTGVKALNESNPQTNDPAPKVKISITGGTFDGEISITDDNSTSITDGKFSDLGGASKYVVDGATIKLAKDLTLTSRTDLVAGKTYTIDLDGHTLSSTETCANGSVFNVVNGNVTIQNGKLVGIAGPTGLAEPYTKECDVITSRAGSKVTLKDLNISINSTTGACVYAFANSEINIVSGTYENKTTETYANDNKMTLNQADGPTQLIFVSGGTFIGRDPAYGDNDQKTSSFLKEGFKSVPVEGEERGVGKYTVCALTK